MDGVTAVAFEAVRMSFVDMVVGVAISQRTTLLSFLESLMGMISRLQILMPIQCEHLRKYYFVIEG